MLDPISSDFDSKRVAAKEKKASETCRLGDSRRVKVPAKQTALIVARITTAAEE